MAHDPKDPFAARQHAVDAALRSKSNPVAQPDRAIAEAVFEATAAAATSGATVDAELAAAAARNGTPDEGRLPLGMGAPPPVRPWARGTPRKRLGPLSPLTDADAELLARAWWVEAIDAHRRTAGWRHVARWVARAAGGHLRSVTWAEGAAMRADRRWAHVVAEGRWQHNERIERYVAVRLKGERNLPRKALRMVARAILKRAEFVGARVGSVAGSARATAVA